VQSLEHRAEPCRGESPFQGSVGDQVDVPHGFAVRDQDREPGKQQGPSWLFAFTLLTEPERVQPDTAGDFFGFCPRSRRWRPCAGLPRQCRSEAGQSIDLDDEWKKAALGPAVDQAKLLR